MDVLLKQSSQISYDVNANVLIKDPQDVDMTFIFKLANDSSYKGSYTKYNVIDRSTGEIVIYNTAGARTISLRAPMPVGTYKLEYKLYVSFTLFISSEGLAPSNIDIVFYINKE